MLSLVDEGKDACEYADTVESVSLRSEVGIWKRRMILQEGKTRGYCK
jgi:hypothetical protein